MSPGGVASDNSVTLTLADTQGMLDSVTLNINAQVKTPHYCNPHMSDVIKRVWWPKLTSCSFWPDYLLLIRVRRFLQCWMTPVYQDRQPAQASRSYWSATIPSPRMEHLTTDTMWVSSPHMCSALFQREELSNKGGSRFYIANLSTRWRNNNPLWWITC